MRTLHLACALVVLATASASASTTHIRWNSCFGDGGAENRFFACDTNAGSEQFVCTFTLSDPIPGVWQIDGVVNMAFAASAVPAWWQFRTLGSCRAASLSVVTAPPLGASACMDWGDGARDALVTYKPGFSAANSAQLEVLSPVLTPSSFDLVSGQEYLAFTAVVNHQ